MSAETLAFQRLRQPSVVTGTALKGALLHLELASVWLRTASDVWLYRPQYSVRTARPRSALVKRSGSVDCSRDRNRH